MLGINEFTSPDNDMKYFQNTSRFVDNESQYITIPQNQESFDIFASYHS